MDVACQLTRDSRRRQRLPDQVEDSMTMDDLARLLAGGHDREVRTPLRAKPEWEVIARRGKRVVLRRRRATTGNHVSGAKELNADDVGEPLDSQDTSRRSGEVS